MRPRPISRGNAARVEAFQQIRAGFNEAATDQSRKLDDDRRHFPAPVASMRPRPISRGNLINILENMTVKLASMRPRPISRGNAK